MNINIIYLLFTISLTRRSSYSGKRPVSASSNYSRSSSSKHLTASMDTNTPIKKRSDSVPAQPDNHISDSEVMTSIPYFFF